MNIKLDNMTDDLECIYCGATTESKLHVLSDRPWADGIWTMFFTDLVVQEFFEQQTDSLNNPTSNIIFNGTSFLGSPLGCYGDGEIRAFLMVDSCFKLILPALCFNGATLSDKQSKRTVG